MAVEYPCLNADLAMLPKKISWPTTVSSTSFVSIRGAWQNNSFFLIGYFKRLSRIVGRVVCPILVDNPCRAGRTNETYAWYRSRNKSFFLGLPTERGSFRGCQCGALFISIRNQIPLPVILPTLLRLVWASGFAWRNPRSCSTFHTFPRLCGCSYLSSQPRMWFCLCVRYDNTEITEYFSLVADRWAAGHGPNAPLHWTPHGGP